jgi:microcystin-dependent protein
MMNDGSIGNAASAATNRANADTSDLYNLLWNNVADAWAPVSGGRGASAAADFAANKRLTLPRALGRAMAGAGAGSGLTSRALGAYTGTETHTLSEAELPPHTHVAATVSGGAHTHTATTDTEPDHRHDFGNHNAVNADIVTPIVGGAELSSVGPGATPFTGYAGAHSHSLTTSSNGAHTHTVTVNNAGSGDAHPNMQPSFFVNFMVKL